MDKINILGINISTLNKKEILEKIEQFLFVPSATDGADGKQHQVVTPNPEFLIAAANHDEEFFYILNKADLAIADGFGLILAGWMMGAKIKRIAGVDLIYDICALAEKKGKSVYLIGGKGGVAEKAGENLKIKFPDLKIAGAEKGLEIGEWLLKKGEWIKGKEKNSELLGRINQTGADIIFAALGHPKQDKWIFHNLGKMPSVKIAMGVGGSFDFIAGKIRRAPRFMRFLGVEWLWRLIIEPWRWKRIFAAVIIFPYKFFFWKFVLPHFYRPNVVCLVYKKEGDNFKILLVARSDQPNHWQLPQGGTDGENIADAGKRELAEELGINNIKIKKSCKNIYKYEFGDKLGKYGVKKKTIMGYKGQKQSLVIVEFLGGDKEIKINFWDHSAWKWVDSENLVNEVHPVRREAAKIFLEKFKNLQITNQV